jgi:hypothetical protein
MSLASRYGKGELHADAESDAEQTSGEPSRSVWSR